MFRSGKISPVNGMRKLGVIIAAAVAKRRKRTGRFGKASKKATSRTTS